MASKSGRKRRQLEQRIAQAGRAPTAPAPTRTSETAPKARPERPRRESLPVAAANAAPDLGSVTNDVAVAEPLLAASAVLAPAPEPAWNPAAESADGTASPWRKSGSVDIHFVGQPVIDALTTPRASVWPSRLESPRSPEPALEPPAPAAVSPEPEALSVPQPLAPPSDMDGEALSSDLARIEQKLDALCQWAREFAAWHGHSALPAADESARKGRLVVLMLALFAPLVAFLCWRIFAVN